VLIATCAARLDLIAWFALCTSLIGHHAFDTRGNPILSEASDAALMVVWTGKAITVKEEIPINAALDFVESAGLA